MDEFAKIKQLLREIIGDMPQLPLMGEVVSVQGESCTVKLISGLELTDVKLKATINGSDDYMLLTPKPGTDVLMLSVTGDLKNLTVVRADEFDKIELSQGGLTILIDGTDGKVSVKNNDASLKGLFEDLATIIKQIKVSTPSGPSGTPLPDTITAVEQWTIKFNKLFK